MEPFVFRQCINILKSTGRKADSLRSLRNEIALVSDESIFHNISGWEITLQYGIT